MIFISHKSDPDHALALSLARMLEDEGVSCWIAPESIDSGSDFAEEIPKAINTCEIFLLILTKEAQNSVHVRKELNLAISHNKQTIPIKIGDFDIDDVFQYLLANVQIRPFANSEQDAAWLIERAKMGEHLVRMETGKNPPRSVSIVRGDYEKNMAEYIRDHPDKLSETVFAMGFSRTANLSVSSSKGIVKWVCKYLCEEQGLTLDSLQQLVDQARVSQLGHSRMDKKLDYKDYLLVSVPLATKDRDESPLTLQLLLIANSIKRNDETALDNLDDVVGIDSREIILETFNACERIGKRARTLFIGAMGTNGLSFPYEVVTAEILNCFAFAQRKDVEPHDLYYSVRKRDMADAGLTVDQILSYISTIVTFLKK